MDMRGTNRNSTGLLLPHSEWKISHCERETAAAPQQRPSKAGRRSPSLGTSSTAPESQRNWPTPTSALPRGPQRHTHTPQPKTRPSATQMRRAGDVHRACPSTKLQSLLLISLAMLTPFTHGGSEDGDKDCEHGWLEVVVHHAHRGDCDSSTLSAPPNQTPANASSGAAEANGATGALQRYKRDQRV